MNNAPSMEFLNQAACHRRKAMVVLCVCVGLCFVQPLAELVRFAAGSSLYSHILLIPVMSLYLLRASKRGDLTAPRTSPGQASLPFTAGAALVAGYWVGIRSGLKLQQADYLAWMMGALLCFLCASMVLFYGAARLRQMAFPLSILLFVIPFPSVIRSWLELSLQQGSTEVANAFFALSGMPVLRHGFQFQLPGFGLQVAPECSGIHSTLVLFITSVLAGGLFLRRPWKRLVLSAVVLPIALLRNGFRILVIGTLCVKFGPRMIDSPIHRHGGPLFFILSLIPFFLLLAWLRKTEQRDKVFFHTPGETERLGSAGTSLTMPSGRGAETDSSLFRPEQRREP